MIRRVFLNQHNVITLDSDMFGSRKRLSTGKKSDKRLMKWYEKHFDEEYKALYEEKFKPVRENFSDYTLREYGKLVLNLTSDNRRAYVQNNILNVFERICNFKIMHDLKFGDMKITDIKILHIMKWQKECGHAYTTIVTNRAYLNMVLQTATDDDIIRKNPVKSVKLPPKSSVRKKTFYSESEIKQLISHSKGQIKNYIQLCCFTGMRGSEMIALRWDDIDFEKGIIRVDTRVVNGNEDATKSKTIRFIPMFRQAREALMNQRLKSGLREFVFINNSGSQYFGTQSFNISFKRMLKKHELPSGTIHDLRRSFNTLLKQYGYPTDWILDIMGHMDDQVNRNHYTGRLDVDMTKIGDITL
jgi:integrase